MARPLPESFGRYRILRPLGEGGMGAVYLARDTQLDRLVALKVPRLGGDDKPAPDDLKRFFREARAAAALLHSNLCPIFDVGEIDGTPYLTMAYLEGRPLSDLVRGKKRLPQRQATQLVRKLALAMQEAHARGVIHRDLKPSNVMVSPRNEPVVLDFGLARRDETMEARLTKPGAVLGTPAYMAPEQIQGEPDAIGPGCDIYALGVILYELLTGHLPFEGSVLTVLGRILTQDPPPPSRHRPDLDPQLEAICLKAMAKKAEDRYASMAELAGVLTARLRAIRETLGTTTAPAAQIEADPTPDRDVDRGADGDGDPPATVSSETLFARPDSEPTPARVVTPSARPGWRDQEPKAEPKRHRSFLPGWWLSSAAIGAVAMLLLGYATFLGLGNRRSSVEPGTNPPGKAEPAPTQPASGPEPPSNRTEPHPRPSSPIAGSRPDRELPIGKSSAVAPPAVVSKATASVKTRPAVQDAPTSKEGARAESSPPGAAAPSVAAKTVSQPEKATPAPVMVKKETEKKPASPPGAERVEKEIEKKPASSSPSEIVKQEPVSPPVAVMVKKEPALRKETPPPVADRESFTTRVGQIKLKRIPAGRFLMGSPEDQGISSEHPRHEVRITRSFYLGVCEVTQGQYRAVMAENPSHFSSTGPGRDKVVNRSTDDHPVENVSWLDAVRFCNILSEREGLKPFYAIDDQDVQVPDWDGTGHRLPTEAEWEYACRAGSTTPFGFSDDEKELAEYAWYQKIAEGQTHAVGQKRSNAWGLHDIHGNVWEWCWDWYDPKAYQRPSRIDPTGPPAGTHRVLRGGSFNDYPVVLRSATRGRDVPGKRDGFNGLRIARTSG